MLHIGTVLFSDTQLNAPFLSFGNGDPCQVIGRWLLILDFTGCFSRIGSGHSARMRYISDACPIGFISFHCLSQLFYSCAYFTTWQVPAMLKFLNCTIPGTFNHLLTYYHYLCEAPLSGSFSMVVNIREGVADIQHAEEAEEGPFSLNRRFSLGVKNNSRHLFLHTK